MRTEISPVATAARRRFFLVRLDGKALFLVQPPAEVDQLAPLAAKGHPSAFLRIEHLSASWAVDLQHGDRVPYYPLLLRAALASRGILLSDCHSAMGFVKSTACNDCEPYLTADNFQRVGRGPPLRLDIRSLREYP